VFPHLSGPNKQLQQLKATLRLAAPPLDDDGRQAQAILSVGGVLGQDLGTGAAFEKADVDGALAGRHAGREGDA
jgi:uncharacterized protein YcfJ